MIPRIAMVDSGVRIGHPHVNGIAGGITVTDEGYAEGFVDCLGHGTAIAGLIGALAPAAELYAVRVFDRRLATSLNRIVRAIDWCLAHEVQIINLSLGTLNLSHRGIFETAAERVRCSQAVLVSAGESDGKPTLPGLLPGVVAVYAEPACRFGEYRALKREGKTVFCAPPFPREIPGVPRERNLHGVSFAVAHISAHLARRWRDPLPRGGWEELLADSAVGSDCGDGLEIEAGETVLQGGLTA